MDAGASGSSGLGTSGPAAPVAAAEAGEPVAGIADGLRGLADGVFGSVKDRLELFSVELQEEKQRLVRTVVWISAFVACALLAVLFASCLLVAACWSTPARVPVVAGLTLAYGIGTLVAWRQLQRCVKDQPPPFAASLEEFQADRRCLERNS